MLRFVRSCPYPALDGSCRRRLVALGFVETFISAFGFCLLAGWLAGGSMGTRSRWLVPLIELYQDEYKTLDEESPYPRQRHFLFLAVLQSTLPLARVTSLRPTIPSIVAVIAYHGPTPPRIKRATLFVL